LKELGVFMFQEILVFTLAGCGLGVITGLIPGIHINMISALIVASLSYFAGFEPLAIAVMIMAMSVTHTFLDFLPSILFGAPDAAAALSVLPGHRMLLDGRALEAVKLTGLGSLISLLLTAGVFLFVLENLEAVYSVLRPNIVYVLLFIVVLSIASEKKCFRALFVFLMAGFFGFLMLNSGMFAQEILFPVLSGMFGISTILLSLREDVVLPAQVRAKVSLSFGSVLKNSALGAVAGMMVGLLPGIGSAQATYVAQQANKSGSVQEFLVAVSGVNTANIIFTLVVLYALGKMRSGIVIAIGQVLETLTFTDLLVFLSVILLAGGIAMLLHLGIGSFLVRRISAQNPRTYKLVSVGIVLLVGASVIALTGVQGLLIMLLSTMIGLMPPLIGVRRAECMGFLLVPVLLFYTGLNTHLLLLFGVH